MVVGIPKAKAYMNLARGLALAMWCVSSVIVPKMRNAYFAADFLVHPTFYDPCSLVVLEALACGLPIITTRYNGASELLHAAAPQQEGYVLAIRTIIRKYVVVPGADARSRPPRRLRRRLRRTAAQWTFEQHYRQLMAVLTEAAAASRRREQSLNSRSADPGHNCAGFKFCLVEDSAMNTLETSAIPNWIAPL